MNTDQATLVLTFLLRSAKRAKSWELSWAAKQRLSAIQQAMEAYEKLTFTSDERALGQLNQVYRLLEALPPAADSTSLTNRRHPLLVAMDNPDPGAEMDAWKVFLDELRKMR
jgi:hypothetical protein